MFKLDLELKQYATDRQWELLSAWEKHGSVRKAAASLGIGLALFSTVKKAVYKKAANQGYSPEHDWTKPVPDGHLVHGVSTYYGKDGEPRGQWVKSKVDKERQEEMLRAMVEGFASELPRTELVVVAASKIANDHLMSCYPISDHHMGMLAWKHETGTPYDLDIGEKLLHGAMDHLVAISPPSKKAAILVLGDFMHYDSFETVTPTSRNALDADSRFPKMVSYTIRAIRHAIKRALERHEEVLVIIEIGNHDLSCSIFLMECLRNVYENDPRVTVDHSPKHFHYFQWGKVLVGTHHGHGTKMPNLPLIMAADQPKAWGETDYRYFWTGHVHKDQAIYAKGAQDFAGCKVESFRILAPGDAWAQQQGYRAMQDMKCIVLHDEYGEVARYTVNPEMLKGE